MAYTASALSMLLETSANPSSSLALKCASQNCVSTPLKNVLGALMLAAHTSSPKSASTSLPPLQRESNQQDLNNALAAFESPTWLPSRGSASTSKWLGTSSSALVPSKGSGRTIECYPNVAVLRLFPRSANEYGESFLSPPLEGVILESYGAGNALPGQICCSVQGASDRGLVIVNITQCVQGEVSAIYAVGREIRSGRSGCRGGYDA